METGEANFETILQQILGDDNDARSRAEKQYEHFSYPQKASGIMNILSNGNSPFEIKSLAAVLLRRIFVNSFGSLSEALSAEEHNILRSQLLLMVNTELNAMLRRKLCEAVAELARQYINDDGIMLWVDILKSLFEMGSSNQEAAKISALYIFGLFPGIFGNLQSQYLELIHQMLQQCLSDANSEVRFEATKTAAKFVLSNDEDSVGADQQVAMKFRDLLPLMIQTMSGTIDGDDDSAFKCLIDLAETCPKFLRLQVENIFAMCLKCLGNTEAEISSRHLALEVMVSLSESAPAMVRKLGPKTIESLINLIFGLMVDLDDEEDWSVQDEVDEDDADSNPLTGETSLDRLACGLGGKTVLNVIMRTVPQMLLNENWKYRYAGLMTISSCAEGCQQQMEPLLPQIVEFIKPFTADSHPRVRYAACNAWGQMCTDFGITFQTKFHEQIVASLMVALNDYDNPRVQAHAGAAFVNFSEDCPKSVLSGYLGPIIEKLEEILKRRFRELLERGTKLVLEQVVTTLAAVADTAEDKFVAFYDRFMYQLKYIVQHAVQPELRLLRGKTIECISLIGLAVGREKFMVDCQDVMELLLKTQTNQSDIEDDDPQMAYMISAWTRMCKILGKDFRVYLELVMGPVLKAASLNPEVAIVDEDEMDDLEKDQDWQVITMSDQKTVGIKTACLDDKANACQMLVCYARELGDAFVDYVDQVAEVMVPLLKFYLSDDIRVAAADILPFLLESAAPKGEAYVLEMWRCMRPTLLAAIKVEQEKEVMTELLRSLAKCIEKCGHAGLDQESCTEVTGVLHAQFEEHFKRQQKRQEQRSDEDYDEEVEEELMNEDDSDVYVLSRLSEVLHSLFYVFGQDYLPFFDTLARHVAVLVESTRPWVDKQWGLCIWDDVIEFAAQSSLPYAQFFLRPIVDSLWDNLAEVRQAAAYGVGILALKDKGNTPVYCEALKESMPRMIQVVQAPGSRLPENINATENVISAVCKVLKHAPQILDNHTEVLSTWFSWLPTWEDEEEAVHIYDYLVELVYSENAVVLVPNLVDVIATAFEKEALPEDSEVAQRLVQIVQSACSNMEAFKACADQLSQSKREALTRFMQARKTS